jgi:hypothetical protein
MEVQSVLFEHTIELERPGEASRQLWSYLTQNHLTSNSPIREGDTDLKRGSPDCVALSLPGRYLMQDGSEFPCKALDISPLGIAIRGVAGGRDGGPVVANFRALGRIEGVMSRKSGIYFVLDIRATPIGLERLSRKLGWQIRRQRGEAPERRKYERVEQNRRKGVLRTNDGRELRGELLDESVGGAALQLGAAALYLWIGQPVTFEGRPAEVLRYFPGGVVLKFEQSVDEGLPASF